MDQDREKKYQTVKQNIIDCVQSGTYSDKLPGERLLARRAGVSYMTVRRAIQELVNEGWLYKKPDYGTYVQLKKATLFKTKKIGFLLLKRYADGGLISPYFAQLFEYLDQAARDKGLSLIYFPRIEDLSRNDGIHMIDALIVNFFPEMIKSIENFIKKVPVILINSPAEGFQIPSIRIDNAQSSQRAVEYLVDCGHKKIGYLTGTPGWVSTRERLSGYWNALEARKIIYKPEWAYEGDFRFYTGYQSAEYFSKFKDKITAIACANDEMALGLIKGLQEKGLQIPDDISIMGFDDIQMSSRIYPGLTTMRINYEDIAQKTFEYIDEWLKKEEAFASETIISTDLIIRDTVRVIK